MNTGLHFGSQWPFWLGFLSPWPISPEGRESYQPILHLSQKFHIPFRRIFSFSRAAPVVSEGSLPFPAYFLTIGNGLCASRWMETVGEKARIWRILKLRMERDCDHGVFPKQMAHIVQCWRRMTEGPCSQRLTCFCLQWLVKWKLHSKWERKKKTSPKK